ncbi:MAG: hypothetical protein IJ196_05905 [Prevotella sp.]|nr:hypothetical protein [Prevotella sp.]
MRKLTFLFTLFFVQLACAQSRPIIFDNVEIGSDYSEVATALAKRYGNPDKKEASQLTYHNKKFHDCDFDVLIFGFKDGKLNEVRLYSKVPTFAASQSRMEAVARKISSTWSLSKDREGKAAWFYVGGIAPCGIGHLLALHTYKVDGGYHTELRFGPF